MKQSYSLNLYWDTRVLDKKTKMSRIFLTVNLHRQQFRVSLKLRSTKADFEKAISSSRNISDSVRELKTQLNNYEVKASTILQRFQVIDKDTFLRFFKSETDLFVHTKTDVFYFFECKIAECVIENRIGTRSYYSDCYKSLKKFNPEINLAMIDERWLRNYQLFLKGNGNSNSTVATRLRGLRVIYNLAANQGFVPKDENPVENFQMNSSVRSKSVLYPAQLKNGY